MGRNISQLRTALTRGVCLAVHSSEAVRAGTRVPPCLIHGACARIARVGIACSICDNHGFCDGRKRAWRTYQHEMGVRVSGSFQSVAVRSAPVLTPGITTGQIVPFGPRQCNQRVNVFSTIYRSMQYCVTCHISLNYRRPEA